MKCLRGMATFAVGAVWPDIVSNHFLPERRADGKIHPTGRLYSAAAEIKTPATKEEVQQIVKEALKQGKKVSIAGAGFSQGKQTLPTSETDVHINMKGLNTVEIDKEKKSARVGGGAIWQTIQDEADKQGLALPVMQASNVFSVGGSLSANCHGWDHTRGPLANTINSITIVNAEGELQILTPQDDLFRYVVGGYGMFGVIVEAEIQLTDNEVLFDCSEEVPIKDYYQYFKEKVQVNPSIKMHLYRLGLKYGKLLQEGWAQNYTTAAPAGPTEELTNEAVRGSLADRILIQVARNSPTARNLWWKRERKNLQKITKATRNQIMRPKINGAFVNNSVARTEWLQEYFVSGEKLAGFIEFLGKVLDKNKVPLFNASVRFVTKDERAELGYATQGDRFAVVLFFSQSLNKKEIARTKRWVQQVINELIKIDGTYYLPYMHFATPEQFRQCYPQWEKVKAKKEEYDPKGLFDNGLFQDYFVKGEIK